MRRVREPKDRQIRCDPPKRGDYLMSIRPTKLTNDTHHDSYKRNLS